MFRGAVREVKAILTGEESLAKCLAGNVSSPGEGKRVLYDSPRTAARLPLRHGCESIPSRR